jgi:hypothetical protein
MEAVRKCAASCPYMPMAICISFAGGHIRGLAGGHMKNDRPASP